MASSKPFVPAVDGWFSIDDPPHLTGSRCRACGTYSFPRECFFCRNPGCTGEEFEEVALSNTGRIWSYTNACYQPPPPFVAEDPFEPFCIAAVELAKEEMVVMGQVVADVDIAELRIGQEVALVIDVLYEDEDARHVVWKWRPTSSGASSGAQPSPDEAIGD